jgi:hypothetical protein
MFIPKGEIKNRPLSRPRARKLKWMEQIGKIQI